MEDIELTIRLGRLEEILGLHRDREIQQEIDSLVQAQNNIGWMHLPTGNHDDVYNSAASLWQMLEAKINNLKEELIQLDENRKALTQSLIGKEL